MASAGWGDDEGELPTFPTLDSAPQAITAESKPAAAPAKRPNKPRDNAPRTIGTRKIGGQERPTLPLKNPNFSDGYRFWRGLEIPSAPGTTVEVRSHIGPCNPKDRVVVFRQLIAEHFKGPISCQFYDPPKSSPYVAVMIADFPMVQQFLEACEGITFAGQTLEFHIIPPRYGRGSMGGRGGRGFDQGGRGGGRGFGDGGGFEFSRDAMGQAFGGNDGRREQGDGGRGGGGALFSREAFGGAVPEPREREGQAGVEWGERGTAQQPAMAAPVFQLGGESQPQFDAAALDKGGRGAAFAGLRDGAPVEQPRPDRDMGRGLSRDMWGGPAPGTEEQPREFEGGRGGRGRFEGDRDGGFEFGGRGGRRGMMRNPMEDFRSSEKADQPPPEDNGGDDGWQQAGTRPQKKAGRRGGDDLDLSRRPDDRDDDREDRRGGRGRGGRGERGERGGRGRGRGGDANLEWVRGDKAQPKPEETRRAKAEGAQVGESITLAQGAARTIAPASSGASAPSEGLPPGTVKLATGASAAAAPSAPAPRPEPTAANIPSTAAAAAPAAASVAPTSSAGGSADTGGRVVLISDRPGGPPAALPSAPASVSEAAAVSADVSPTGGERRGRGGRGRRDGGGAREGRGGRGRAPRGDDEGEQDGEKRRNNRSGRGRGPRTEGEEGAKKEGGRGGRGRAEKGGRGGRAEPRDPQASAAALAASSASGAQKKRKPQVDEHGFVQVSR